MTRDQDQGRTGDEGGLATGQLSGLLGYHLRQAQVAMFRHFDASVGAEEGITPGLFGVLQRIAANPGLGQSRLAEAMGVDRSLVVKVVDRLTARDLIERRASPHDRRSHCLHLTANGTAALARMEQAVRDHEDSFAAALTAAERAQLIGLLRRLHQENSRSGGET